MPTDSLKTRVLLLVEDEPADATLVAELLAGTEQTYHIIHSARLAAGVERLSEQRVDVIVLDLRLPDCSGVDTVRAFRAAAGSIPIVVLTGSDDPMLSMRCIEAGAQDYLSKNELKGQNLRRAIGYAITRVREAQLREMQDMVARYRALSTHTQTTTVTASLVGSGAIAVRHPTLFERLACEYRDLCTAHGARRAAHPEAARSMMETIVTGIGDANGGPRDLLDVHVAALDLAVSQSSEAQARQVVFEARLLALEMMGLLVDYYRVGLRRYPSEGKKS